MSYRSRRGCHTCKRRHKKCDETRPFCTRCAKGGFQCDGYETRLTWGQEDASARQGVVLNPVRQKRAPRRMKHRDVTLHEHPINDAPAMHTGEVALSDEPVRDVASVYIDEHGLQYSFSQWELDIISHEPAYNSPTSENALEKRLMDAFTSHGYLALTGRVGDQNLLISEIVPMTEHCFPLRNVCMAYQASLENDKELTGTYLERGLYGYYSNLFQHDELVKDSTLATGVLLCSVSISSLYIWTPLLRGLYWIMETRGLLTNADCPELAAHLMEVVGLLDMPCFVLGHTGESMQLWKKHIAPFTKEAIEQSSAMPYSLLNIMSEIEHTDAETLLHRWSGLYTAEFALLHLWEALRGAAVLHARMLKRVATDHEVSPSDEVVIMQTLASIQAVRDIRKEECSVHISEHVVYPLFIASIATNDGTAERRLATKSWQLLLEGAERQKNQLCYDIVLEVWKRRETEDQRSPWHIANDFAKELNIEFYLS